jgi:hypothetical protein
VHGRIALTVIVVTGALLLTAPAAGAQVGTPSAARAVPSATLRTATPHSADQGVVGGFGPWLSILAVLGTVAGVVQGVRTRSRHRAAHDATARASMTASLPPRWAVPMASSSVIHVPNVYSGRALGTRADVDITPIEPEPAEPPEPAPDRTAERRVAAELAGLPNGAWWVVDDLVVGDDGAQRGNLLIGVGGIFTVIAKDDAWPVRVAERMVLVAGRRTAYLQDAVADGKALTERLTRASGSFLRVFPVIAFVNTAVSVEAMPRDAAVVPVNDLVDWLVDRPPALTSDEACVIARHARSAATAS